jgi:hypothetical protein
VHEPIDRLLGHRKHFADRPHGEERLEGAPYRATGCLPILLVPCRSVADHEHRLANGAKTQGVADKPRQSYGQLGRFRRLIRLRFPGAVAFGLEEQILVCSRARAVQSERERRRQVFADESRQRREKAFRTVIGSGSVPLTVELRREAHELQVQRAEFEKPYKLRRSQKERVVDAANDLIAYVQRRLCEYESAREPVPVFEQHELWFLQQVAIDAWGEAARKKSDAKSWQIAVATELRGGPPLAICYDRPLYDFTEEGLGRVAAPEGSRWGCGVIFEDSTHAGGTMFSARCGGCNGDKRKPKLEAHALAKKRIVRRT